MTLKIGYYDPFNIYPLIQPSLEAKLPLANLHWKMGASSTLKSIPKLPVDLVEELPKKVDSDITIRLMFIQSQNIDTYKSQVRPLIKEWLKHSVRPQVQWLIVLYTPVKKDKYTFKTSIHEKLKVDFGANGKELESANLSADQIDRCFRLKETNDNEINKLELYNEFVNRLKEMVLKSFTSNFEALDEQLNSCKTKDLIYTELMLKKSTRLDELFLFKDALAIVSESSKLIKNYYSKNKGSYKFEVPNTENMDWDKFYEGFSVNILNETNAFNLLTHVFAMTFRTLIKMIDNESLTSMRAIYLSNLFQEFLIYLNELIIIGSSALPFCYNAIEWVLNYPVIQDLKSETEVDLSHFYEFRGDLKLFQRSIFYKLGELRGYRIHDFEEVSLNDDTTVVDIPSNIEKLMKNENRFYQSFERSTESTIADFVLCNRTKTIDVLSIDLAILHYRQKDYKESLNILQNSYEFFIEHGWNYMGGLLLRIYIDCIESLQLKDSALLVKSYVKLFSNMTNHKIDINRPIKDKDQVSQIFDRILQSTESELEFPISNLAHFELDPYISLCGSKYCMNLKLFNVYGIELKFHSIVLELSGALDFVAENVVLTENNEHQIPLYSTKIIVDYFRPVRLVINVNSKLKLVHDFSDVSMDAGNSILDESVMKNNVSNIPNEINTIHFFPDPKHFNCDVTTNPQYLLGSHSVLVRLQNGLFEIDALNCNITGTQNFKMSKQAFSKVPKKLNKNENFDFAIPVELTSDNKEISLTLVCNFLIDGVSHEYVIAKTLDLSLLISVSVQDIFKVDYTFSNFKIAPAVTTPIRVLSTNLAPPQNTKDYHIITPPVKAKDSIVSSGQVYSSFYKIVVNNNYKIKYADELQLTVFYSSVLEECRNKINPVVLEALDTQDLGQFRHFYLILISPLLKFDYQAYAADSKIVVTNITEIKEILSRNIRFINPVFSQKLQAAVLEAISHEQTVSGDPGCSRTLDILVPVPKIDVLQTIEFHFEKKDKYLVGEPILVDVKVESCTRWKSRPAVADHEHTQEDLSIIAESSLLEEESVETFFLNLLNDENWLVSGFKRKQMSLDLNKNMESDHFELILIPLAIGKLTLPKLSIKFLNNDLTVDVSTKNGTENLLVVPELERLTFSF